MTFDPKALQKHVAQALARIPGMTDCKKLQALHRNIHDTVGLDDLDREKLNDATSERIQIVCPKLYKEMNGPRDAQGRAFIEGLCADLLTDFDLSGNQLRNGLKIGGCMMNGSRWVDVYTSYKSQSGINLSIAWLQIGPKDTPYIVMLLRDLRANKDIRKEEQRREFDSESDARTAFMESLQELINAG